MHELTLAATVTNTIPGWQYFLTIAIFLVTYAIIISEKINRAVIALFGASLLIIIGVVDFKTAMTHHIEWGTITLLIGMMILVNITAQSGVFSFVAVWAAKKAKGSPIRILLYLSIITAIGSAFLDNVTTVLLIVPVTFTITRILGVNPTPYLISEILLCNIGGTATLIGDPPNIMIGSANKHLDFNSFLFNLAPIVIIITIVVLGILYLIYRKQLHADETKIQELMKINEKEYITDSVLLVKALSVLGITIVCFMLHSVLHLDAAVIAMFFATVLMLLTVRSEHEVELVFSKIEWVTIFFFAGLFILVGGLVDIGLIGSLAQSVLDITEGNITFTALLILWVSGIASATIDNIPFVATMIPLIKDLAVGMGLSPDHESINILWWSLALGACLGGNGTILGASANVIVVGMAAKEGKPITYMKFLKIGALITLLTLIISTIYIYVRYLI